MNAIEVPLRTMQAAYDTFDILEYMAANGNPASVSDAGVGALAARAAVLGASLNVRINAEGLKDKELAARYIRQAEEIVAKAVEKETHILGIVNKVISQ